MIKQFFGKTTLIALGIIILLWSLALLGYFSNLDVWLLLIVWIVSFGITIKRLEFGIYLAFIELFSSPHGQLLSTELGGFVFSLRMCIFSAVLAAWMVSLLTKKTSMSVSDERWYWFLPLGLAVMLGIVLGSISNGFPAAFSDGNAYLYLGYLFPILSVAWTQQHKKDLLQLLAAGAISIAVFSLCVLYVFSHFDVGVLRATYVVLRDLRTVEITNIGAGVYRVFSQIQFFVISFLFLIAGILFQGNQRWKEAVGILALMISTVVLSLSRSFWVGLLAATAVFILLVIIKMKPQWKQWGRTIGQTTTSFFAAIFLILLVALFPIPTQDLSGSDLADAFAKRAEADDVAVSSRWNLLTPMVSTILEHPIEGSGFGTAVTFISDDPRVREISEDGSWSTVSMEWGWLEIWIKMGILAPLGFLYLFYMMTKRLLAYAWTDQAWLGIGLLSGLVFLYATHFFSPYLNHPIGLGFILFCIPFLPNKQKVAAQETETINVTLQTKQVAAATIQTD